MKCLTLVSSSRAGPQGTGAEANEVRVDVPSDRRSPTSPDCRPELASHGTPFERRFGVLRERSEVMKQIWSQERAGYDGARVDFDPIALRPRLLEELAGLIV